MDMTEKAVAQTSAETSRNESHLKSAGHIYSILDGVPANLRGSNTHPLEAVLKYCLLKFVSDDSGATASEYGLIAAGISIAILAAVNGLGSNLNTMFSSVNSSLK
jgi:pilus assembly protein Flp/PilA